MLLKDVPDIYLWSFYQSIFFIRLLNHFFFCFVWYCFFYFASVIFICYLFLFIFWRARLSPSRGRAGRHGTADLTLSRPPDPTVQVGQGCADPDPLDPWFPGPGRDTVPPGPLGYSEHCTPPQATAGWGTGRLGYPSTAQLPYSYRLHPPTPLRWLGTGLGPGPHYKHDLKGERWVSGGAGGRREERGWAILKNWIFSKFFQKIQSYSIFSSPFTLMYIFLI